MCSNACVRLGVWVAVKEFVRLLAVTAPRRVLVFLGLIQQAILLRHVRALGWLPSILEIATEISISAFLSFGIMSLTANATRFR